MLQLLYISTAQGTVSATDVFRILADYRRNNGRSDITGFLYSDGKRFLQALEGNAAEVEETFERIRADKRHSGVVVLSRRTIEAREFGEWAMESRGAPGNDDAVLRRVNMLVANASPTVQATFNSFAQVRRAA